MDRQHFQYDGKIFTLNHLQPRTIRFERPAEGNKAKEIYTVDVRFTSHCFTRAPRQQEFYDENLVYPDTYEVRLFDLRRYEASKHLPEIIQSLPLSKPRQSNGRGKYFTVELILEKGETVEYDIFFKLSKQAKGRLEMLVETAFIREPEYRSTRPNGKPIRFWIILHHTLHNIGIRG